MKTLRQGVCAWCDLIPGGELMSQFSLRPSSQLGPLPLDVGLRFLHQFLVGFDLGGRKVRERGDGC